MAIFKRGGVWWLDVYIGTGTRRKRVRKSTGCKEEVQARMVEQSMVAVNRGLTSRQRAQRILDNILPVEDRGVAIGDCRAFYERCIEQEGAGISKHELQKRLNIISRMSDWMIGNTRVEWVSDVNPETAWAYSCAIGKRDVSVKTRNNEIGHLRTTWKMFEKHGKAEVNPWSLARVGRNRDEETHGRAFTDNEIKRLLTAARKMGCEWEGVITVALYTGLRLGDVINIRWSGDPNKSVIADMKAGKIYGTPSKTARRGVRVNIPMHTKVKAVLANEKKNGELVFPWRASHICSGHRRKGDVWFSDIMDAAKITVGEGEKVSFHSLRHTFVTRLAESGVAEDVRMRLAGHTNAATHGVYTHEDTQSRKAIEGLE